MKAEPLIDRLRKRLRVMPSGCWEFEGFCNPAGYGLIGAEAPSRKVVLTHRVAWEIVFGPIPDGLCVLHECDNPPCCNPAHLWLGTRGDNNRDRRAKGRQVNPCGEQHGRAKLTWEQVREIRADARTHLTIAETYGVGETAIFKIKHGENWKEVAP